MEIAILVMFIIIVFLFNELMLTKEKIKRKDTMISVSQNLINNLNEQITKYKQRDALVDDILNKINHARKDK